MNRISWSGFSARSFHCCSFWFDCRGVGRNFSVLECELECGAYRRVITCVSRNYAPGIIDPCRNAVRCAGNPPCSHSVAVRRHPLAVFLRRAVDYGEYRFGDDTQHRPHHSSRRRIEYRKRLRATDLVWGAEHQRNWRQRRCEEGGLKCVARGGMTAARLVAGNEQRGVFLDGSVDRERTRLPGDVDCQISQTETARQSRLPPRRCALTYIADGEITDEVFFADKSVRCGIERGRRGANLLAIAFDQVIEGRGLQAQCHFRELLRLTAICVAMNHHRHA